MVLQCSILFYYKVSSEFLRQDSQSSCSFGKIQNVGDLCGILGYYGCGSLTMAFTDKFVCMAHHFVLLRLNPFDLRVDREGWWFEHSVS